MKAKSFYIRWTLNERFQHWALAISFIVLVITGFQLKYPDAWWAKLLVGGEWLFDLRGLLHRIAGTVMLMLGFYHVYYMIATRRGRQLSKNLLPGKKDIRDLVQNMSYNLGLKQQPPEFGHFSYMEKTEYFALIWGVFLMGATGMMLWFEGLTLIFFPKWVIDLLTVIHLYEAWLATLAIVVWHFYYVIFNPEVYPLDTAMYDGKISDKMMRHEHGLEWQQLQKTEKPKEALEKEE